MAKKTLLQLTQDVLNDISSDEVNSINDTPDANQVALIIKNVYLEMIAHRNWPHLRKLIQLQASGNVSLPTHMTVQDEIKELIFVNYNCAKVEDGDKRIFQPMKWKEQDDFLRLLNSRDNTQSNVIDVVDPSSGITLAIRNDLPPTYFTSFDDKTLVFDSFDSEIDDTLQQSKIQAMAFVNPSWTHSDSFIPDLPEEAFPALLSEATSVASLRLNQAADQKAEQSSQRQQAWLARKSWRVNGGIRYPNYGRKSAYKKDPTFRRDN